MEHVLQPESPGAPRGDGAGPSTSAADALRGHSTSPTTLLPTRGALATAGMHAAAAAGHAAAAAGGALFSTFGMTATASRALASAVPSSSLQLSSSAAGMQGPLWEAQGDQAVHSDQGSLWESVDDMRDMLRSQELAHGTRSPPPPPFVEESNCQMSHCNTAATISLACGRLREWRRHTHTSLTRGHGAAW